jgi:predicted DNA-binding transcriptional regulator YafY
MRADRLLEIVLLLQNRGKMTAQTLATELEVSRRTILRDIDALSFAGIPIYAEGGHGGGIALDENYRTSLTGLREIEAFTLFINSNTKLLGDIGLGHAAETTFLKLFASLPAAHKPTVESMRQRFLIDPDWWWHETQPSPNWDQLEQAVYEDRYIQVHYEKFSGEIVERTLQPYSLVAKSSLWYLIAKRDDDFRIYRVSDATSSPSSISTSSANPTSIFPLFGILISTTLSKISPNSPSPFVSMPAAFDLPNALSPAAPKSSNSKIPTVGSSPNFKLNHWN